MTETIIIPGNNGKTYYFEKIIYGKELPEYSGIYIVLKYDRVKGVYNILYIGKADNIKERHSDHHKAECFDKHGVTHIGFLHTEDERSKDIIEKDLLLKYSTPCNVQLN